MIDVTDLVDAINDSSYATTDNLINVVSYQLFAVQSEQTTADLIVWQLYKRPAYGVVEAMLDANPHLAAIHKTSPFLPPGTLVRVPITSALMNATQAGVTNRNFWG